MGWAVVELAVLELELDPQGVAILCDTIRLIGECPFPDSLIVSHRMATS